MSKYIKNNKKLYSQWNFEKNVRSGLLFLLKYELHEEFNAEKYCLVNRDIMKF